MSRRRHNPATIAHRFGTALKNLFKCTDRICPECWLADGAHRETCNLGQALREYEEWVSLMARCS